MKKKLFFIKNGKKNEQVCQPLLIIVGDGGGGKQKRNCGFFEHGTQNLGMFSSLFCLNPHQAALNACSLWIILGPFLICPATAEAEQEQYLV